MSWPELTSSALVGTARRPLRAWPLPQVDAPADASPEIVLLHAAALAQAQRAGGTLPPAATNPFDPAPDDELRDPGPLATQLLELVLFQNPAGAGARPSLVVAWARAASGVGCHVPAHLLVPLLNLAPSMDTETARALREVLDARGRWLAALHPHGARLTAPAHDLLATTPDQWGALPSAERVSVLKNLRDVDPGAGLALVTATWQDDPARDRVELIRALQIGLSMRDEPFLEHALDDRSASVREAAWRLLEQLPQSRRAQRMAARLAPLVHPAGVLRAAIAVDLPDDPDAAAVRDGLVPSRAGSQRDFWLTSLVLGAPVTFWDHLGSPGFVLDHLDSPAARKALTIAVERQRQRGPWAAALASREPTPAVLALLPPDDLEHAAARLLHDAPGRWVNTLVNAVPAPWSADLSRRLVDAVIASKQPAPAQLPKFALALHPSAVADLSHRVGRVADRATATALSHAVNHRSMLQSIQEAFR